jgi:chorismate lyase
MRNKRVRALQDKRMSPELRQWLYASGSLTQQLTDLGQGEFKVIPTQEYFQRLNHADAKWMNVSHQQTSWVRETLLYGSEEHAWVKAKSIFPITSLQKRVRIFQHIGRRPIGYWLFKRTNPACERRVVWQEDGWTRQSCYTWHGCKFIVQETFLTAFEQFIQQD